MKRDLALLADRSFDVLVVGAGIHGACIAREAALQGLSVALVDRGDFGAATSANSLKVVHGGLRYIQTLDFGRMRESVHEQQALCRMAPHLVRPLPFVIPTFGMGKRSKHALRAGLLATRLIAPQSKYRLCDEPWPKSQMLSRDELADLFPKLAQRLHITGGALWYDAQVDHTERLTLAFVRSAVSLGCVAANYAEVTSLTAKHNRIVGAAIKDQLSGESFEMRASLTINAAGPWVQQVLGQSKINASASNFQLAKAWNVVTKAVHPTHAIGVLCGGGGLDAGQRGRMLFATPWRDRSIIGTMYAAANSATDALVTPKEIQELIDAFNVGLPDSNLTVDDVSLRHVGVLPAQSNAKRDAGLTLSDKPRLIDHFQTDRLAGLVSVVGVKYTTARFVAKQVIDLAANKLGRPLNSLDSSLIPVDGGDIENVAQFSQELERSSPAHLKNRVKRLVRHYGTRAVELLDMSKHDPKQGEPITNMDDTTRAEVRYACKEEMSVRLLDVLARRTDLGIADRPSDQAMQACAHIMADELDWSSDRISQELIEAQTHYA